MCKGETERGEEDQGKKERAKRKLRAGIFEEAVLAPIDSVMCQADEIPMNRSEWPAR